MKKIMSILVLVLFVFSAMPVLAEEVDTVDATETDETDIVDAEETDATETDEEEEEVAEGEEPNTVNPDSVLHGLDLLGERIRYIFTRKIDRAEYRLEKIRERQAEMEEMSKKYTHKVQQMEKFIEKARVNMEKHMQRIEGDIGEVEEGNETVVRHGLEKSRERLLLLLERKPESKGLKRALQTHDINIEKIRLRLTKVNGEEEPEEEEEETDEEGTSEGKGKGKKVTVVGSEGDTVDITQTADGDLTVQ